MTQEDVEEELATAKEEIAKLNSIRNELARERNDATEEKAELRRKLELLKGQVNEIEKLSRGATQSGQAQEEETKHEIE
jgi:chromosome segregation ATPase